MKSIELGISAMTPNSQAGEMNKYSSPPETKRDGKERIRRMTPF